MTTHPCPHCGTPTTSPAPTGQTRTYCTRACAGQARNTRRIWSAGVYVPRPPPGPPDPVVIDRLTHGQHTPATAAEITAAIAQLETRHLSASTIAMLVGVSERTVTRHRARQQKAAA